MYNEFYGLTKSPFNMTPDPAFLFLTPQYREALAGLTFSILQRKGFLVLTGDAGTGKTTLLARILQFLPTSQLQFSLILNPTLTPAEFLELTLLDFGVQNIPTSKAQRLWKLQALLLEADRKGKVSALIVDEAHKLSPEVLEEIRLLGNFEDADHKYLQILLVGQKELNDVLQSEELRQLKQRIAVRLAIGPLATPEVAEYIRHRWLRAGGTQPPFSAASIDAIGRASQGIPRIINGLCDNALIVAYGEKCSEVELRHVQEAATDLHITQPLAPAPGWDEIRTPQPATEMVGSRWSRWSARFGLPRTRLNHSS